MIYFYWIAGIFVYLLIGNFVRINLTDEYIETLTVAEENVSCVIHSILWPIVFTIIIFCLSFIFLKKVMNKITPKL